MLSLLWNLLVGFLVWMVAVLFVVAVAGLVFFAYLYLRDWWQIRYVRSVQAMLKAKPFFHDLHFGAEKHVKGTSYKTYVEAPLSVVLQHRGKPAAVISFRLLPGKRMRVVQMQGLKKAKLYGVDVSQWLVELVEETARTLQCKEVQIIKASEQTYYGTIAGPKGPDHQERMRRRYDEVPAASGYTLKRKWWRKRL